LRDFKPKSESDYDAYLIGRSLRKTRRHERLVRLYGEWCATRGLEPSTAAHPRDLILRRAGEEWLVEAKVLYQGNATEAVRAALGQLYTYRHFLYPSSPPTGLVALFSEAVGAGYTDFLSGCGIESVWWEAGLWIGTTNAVAAKLAEFDGTQE
jgi:hypothetical protein